MTKNSYNRIIKVILNICFGVKGNTKTFFNNTFQELRTISGQNPTLTYARHQVAEFGIKRKMNIGLKVTLRKQKMYSFLDRLINLVLPGILDFQGLSINKFDIHGNYNFGLSSQLLFPEILFGSIDAIRGYDITIVTSTKNKVNGFELLKQIGFPFSDKS